MSLGSCEAVKGSLPPRNEEGDELPPSLAGPSLLAINEDNDSCEDDDSRINGFKVRSKA